MIVDDKSNLRKLLKEVLISEGYQCFAAKNAFEALNLLNTNSIQLVLCDIKMPKKEGIELIQQLMAKDKEIAIIMSTAVRDIDTVINCMKSGVYDYLIKPFSLDKLIMSVESALERRRLIIENKEYQQHLEKKVEILTDQIRYFSLDSIKALACALEARDRYTQGHSLRVTQYSLEVAKQLSLSKKRMEQLRLAGLLHDIGKIGIREHILSKPTKLTREEYEQVKIHPLLSVQILLPVIKDKEVIKIIKHHHERWDGAGFPQGLKREEIPMGSRIIMVCDTFDALTSNRPYRKAPPEDNVYGELKRFSGSQFDPHVVEAFLEIPRKRLKKIKSLLIPSLLNGFHNSKPGLIDTANTLSPETGVRDAFKE